MVQSQYADQLTGHSLTDGVFLERDFQAQQTDPVTGTSNAFASFGVSCFAVPGTLRIGAVGGLAATTTTPYDASSGVATASFSTVSASWADTTFLHVPNAELGRSFTLNVYLYLDGDLDLQISKTGGYGIGRGDIKFSLSGLGMPPAPYGGGYWGHVVRDITNPNNDVTELPGGAIPLAIPMLNGEPAGFNWTMFITGEVVVSNQALFDAPGFGMTDALFSADFSQSLTWGGISGVTDTVTGLPVTDWTITSASGFDYSQPVPEPASPALVGILSAWFAAARRRQDGGPVS